MEISNCKWLDFWFSFRRNFIPFGNKTFTVRWEEFLERFLTITNGKKISKNGHFVSRRHREKRVKSKIGRYRSENRWFELCILVIFYFYVLSNNLQLYLVCVIVRINLQTHQKQLVFLTAFINSPSFSKKGKNFFRDFYLETVRNDGNNFHKF